MLHAQGAHQEGNTIVRRRLRIKTVPTDAPGYPQRSLLTKADWRIQKGKLKEAQRKEWAKYKSARAEAVAALAKQTEHRSSWESEQVTAAANYQMPNPSHHITVMQVSRDIIYSKACACWSLRSKLKGLAGRCVGLKSGNASTIRLLQCGVKPEPEARLPPRQVKRRHRKSRW